MQGSKRGIDKSHLLAMVDDATAGSTVYPPGGRWGPRIQQNLQLVLVHTGHVHIHVDDEVHFVPAGHVALLHPGHREDFYFSEKSETWHHWVHIQLNDNVPEQRAMLERLPRFIPLSDTMNRLTDSLQSLTHSSIQNIQEDVRCTLGVAAIMLYQSESRHGYLEKGKHPSIVRTKDEIHKNYDQPLHLDRLAALSNVSPEYLIRLFRQAEGVTPMRYLWKVRMDHAQELLRSTGLSLGEIAERTGFKSVYHLSRLIKNFSGRTPTEIRRNS
ncbi:AraC family transcriptional regulator [Paenibacillus alkalitolerans]|uniref:AraC family transcriptional regulator n=1 Tax=Paenibacillus alkalitolerans TaxID=2799335 RepID=UPI0018F3AADD|nr:AraC family transcriptional regulator [Paenibacillus alkalitolerans]